MTVNKTTMVSVVIPTYNHGRYLGRALESVIEQTYLNWEVIVIDNHSTDDTEEVLASFNDPRIKAFKIHNQGVIAASRNAGIREAKGDWIAFLDSDDWWSPKKLEHSCRAMQHGADIVYHDLRIVRSSGKHLFNERVRSTPPISPMFSALLCKGMSIPNSSVLVRKALLEQIGGISEDSELIAIEDFDTWLSLAKITERFVRLPVCDGYYWISEDNMSVASPKQQQRISALYKKHLGDLTPKDQNHAQDFLIYRLARIAQMYGDCNKALMYYRKTLMSSVGLLHKCKAVYFSIRAAWAVLRKLCESA